MTATIPAIPFVAPPVNPAPNGLYSIVDWVQNDGPSRFLGDGIYFRPLNYGGSDAFGVWEADWCVDPEDQVKTGTRPADGDPFTAITVWAWDECDLTAPSQAEIQARVQQNLRLLEPIAVETQFSVRLLADGATPHSETSFIAALCYLEAELAATNTLGIVHASAAFAGVGASSNGLLTRAGSTWKTPLGHTVIFGGGYVAGLGTTLVATSPVFGWRDQPQVTTSIKHDENQFVALAERSVALGYEKCVAAVAVSG